MISPIKLYQFLPINLKSRWQWQLENSLNIIPNVALNNSCRNSTALMHCNMNVIPMVLSDFKLANLLYLTDRTGSLHIWNSTLLLLSSVFERCRSQNWKCQREQPGALGSCVAHLFLHDSIAHLFLHDSKVEMNYISKMWPSSQWHQNSHCTFLFYTMPC